MSKRTNSTANKEFDSLHGDEQSQQSEPFMFQMRNKGNTIAAHELLDISPQPFHGHLLKKDNSWAAYLFPCLFPAWKQRFFILVGNYLFRFADMDGEAPKGVPIPLDGCMIKELENNQFEINSLRKTYVLQATDEAESKKWLKAIRTRKMEAIRENMGHVEISAPVRKANRIGNRLFSTRLSIDRAKTQSIIDEASNPLTKLH